MDSDLGSKEDEVKIQGASLVLENGGQAVKLLRDWSRARADDKRDKEIFTGREGDTGSQTGV